MIVGGMQSKEDRLKSAALAYAKEQDAYESVQITEQGFGWFMAIAICVIVFGSMLFSK